ncbi:MAG: hypothetical protein WC997_18145 [Porticoccaceae bacterium]
MQHYIIYKAWAVKDELKARGGRFDRDHKGWIVSKEVIDELNARGSSWGMAWARAWGNVVIEPVEV